MKRTTKISMKHFDNEVRLELKAVVDNDGLLTRAELETYKKRINKKIIEALMAMGFDVESLRIK